MFTNKMTQMRAFQHIFKIKQMKRIRQKLEPSILANERMNQKGG